MSVELVGRDVDLMLEPMHPSLRLYYCTSRIVPRAVLLSLRRRIDAGNKHES
jgi:hypothetical protein